MSASDLPPLDPDLAELLDAERRREAPPTDVRAAVSRDLTAQLSARLAVAVKDVPAPRSWTQRQVAQIAILSFAVGGLAGVVGHSRFAAPAPIVVSVNAPSIAPTAAAVPSVAPAPPPSVAPVPALVPRPPEPATISSPARPARSARGADDDLAAEQVLVETARTALGRRDSASALAALDRHAREFPHGRLDEEADVVRIQALAMAGRTDDARTRADAFRARYPKSVFLTLLDDVLRSP